MRILDVIHGVLGILLDCKVEVEIHLGVCLAHIEKEARRIDRDLVEQVGKLD